MEEFEIIETIKTKTPNRPGFAELWSDRILVKSKVPRWLNFPAHIQPTDFVLDYERAKNFQVYEDDVWLIGFPRSGTTMLQELLWILVNDFDFDGAMKADTYNRAQYFEFWNTFHKHQQVSVDYIDKMKRPRVFKTHAAVQFLPDQIWSVKPPIIHISRDVKDVAVSFYHLRKDILFDDVGNIEEHFDEILNDKAWWCPYREHLMNYKNLPHYENIFLTTYEEVVNDMEGTIRKLATFLDKEASDQNVERLKEHMSFEKMSKNKMTNMQDLYEKWKEQNPHDRPTNTLIRKGVIGDHKNYMTEDTIKRFDEWLAESKNMQSPWSKN